MKTKVIFRTFKNTGDVIALFPEVPADIYGTFCQSYQHGAADPHLDGTRPATPEEIAPLRTELEAIGYKLEPVTRVTAGMFRTRRMNIK